MPPVTVRTAFAIPLVLSALALPALATAPSGAAASGCSSLLYGSDLLGRMYNVKTGKVASADSVTGIQLFDLKCQSTNSATLYGTTYAYPASLTLTPSAQTTVNDAVQSTYSYDEIDNNFEVDLGVQGVSSTFSAELDASVALSSTHSVATSYVQANAGSVLESYRLALPAGAAGLRDLLIPGVKADIDTMEPNALVGKYGTHFLNSSVFGGRWLFSQSISNSQTTDTQSIEGAVQANYNAYSANVSAGQSTKDYDSNTQTAAVFVAIGGAPIAGQTTLSQWAATVPGNFGLIQFDRQSGTASLLPLSVLATTAQRASEINQAIVAALQPPQFSFYNLVWDNSGIPTTIVGEKSYQLTDVGKIIVGIALNVEDNNVSHMAVQTRDLNSGDTAWVDVEGRPFNQNSYEAIYSLEDTGKGLAAVGYCFSADKNVPNTIGLYHRAVNATKDTSGFLQGDVALGYNKGPNCEQSFNPGNGAQKVLVGIGIIVHDNAVGIVNASFAPLKASPATVPSGAAPRSQEPAAGKTAAGKMAASR
ncbi:hypothetical protein J2847_003004 [Azospirillum agricola]|uniref:MAC/perforin domain-containing protein n=1 Tax=Azospirillum agricola TaxID=1720247 RepID=UPI001AE60ED0|nr:MAC/perforin domain-containing protein [Azospirillum agricola]MBP2229705.1 hypothetical protein [Azospirillum agricola]